MSGLVCAVKAVESDSWCHDSFLGDNMYSSYQIWYSNLLRKMYLCISQSALRCMFCPYNENHRAFMVKLHTEWQMIVICNLYKVVCYSVIKILKLWFVFFRSSVFSLYHTIWAIKAWCFKFTSNTFFYRFPFILFHFLTIILCQTLWG